MATLRVGASWRRKGVRSRVVTVLLLAAVTGCATDSPAESAPDLARALDRVDSAIVGGRSAEIEDAVDTLILATRQAQAEGSIDPSEAERIVTAAEDVLSQLPDDAAKTPESSPSEPVESPSVAPTPGGGKSPGKGKGKKKGRGKP